MIEIPTKRHRRTVISYLDRTEIDALLASARPNHMGRPPRPRDAARRDPDRRARLRARQPDDRRRRASPPARTYVCWAKVDKERCAILTNETVAVLRAWLRERQGEPHQPLFPTRRGGPLTTRAFALRLDKHIATAARALPVARHQADHAAHAPAHQRDAAQSRERRHLHDRALARTRDHQIDRALPPRRQQAQAGTRSNEPHRSAPDPAATGRPTHSSRSSKDCDYPKQNEQLIAEGLATSNQLQITRGFR